MNISVEWGGLLLVAFVVLKLCNVINWSWWWVTAPAWMPLCGILGFLLVVAIIGGIAMFIAWCCDKHKVNKK